MTYAIEIRRGTGKTLKWVREPDTYSTRELALFHARNRFGSNAEIRIVKTESTQ